MKRYIFLTLYLLLATLCNGQEPENKLFESKKGKLFNPLPKFIKIVDNEERKRYTVNMFDSTLRMETDSTYEVRAIHEGSVVGLFDTKGDYTILTQFGDYFIAYSGLTKPKIKKGDLIKSGQVISTIVNEKYDKNYILELTLLKGTNELSLANWIKW